MFLRVFRGCSWTHLIPAAHVDQRRPPRRLPPPRWSPPPTTLCPRNWPNRPHSPCSGPHSHLAELAFACCSRLFLDAPMQGVARGPDGIWRPRVRSPPCLTLSASHRRADPRFLDPQRNKILHRHVHRPVHWTQPLHQPPPTRPLLMPIAHHGASQRRQNTLPTGNRRYGSSGLGGSEKHRGPSAAWCGRKTTSSCVRRRLLRDGRELI